MSRLTATRISRSQASKSRTRQTSGKRQKRQADSPIIHPLLQLQQTYGNHAVGRMIQAKLQVSQPGDQYEQEADRVSEQVMRMPDPTNMPGESKQSWQPSAVQRVCAECGEEMQRQPVEEEKKPDEQLQMQAQPGQQSPSLAPNLQPRIAGLQSGGRPLQQSERAFFEPRFSRDFSQVRVHTVGQAADIAKSINARAFTVGNNIAFRDGQFAPGSQEGRKLLAHELTHTIQQGAVNVSASKTHGPATTANISVQNQRSTSSVVQPRKIVGSSPMVQRKAAAAPVDSGGLLPVNAAERATPENLALAQIIDALDKLERPELLKLREKTLAGLTSPDRDEQRRHLQTLEAIEFLAEKHGLERLDYTKDVANSRRNVRVSIEERVRATGSFKKAMGEFTRTKGIEAHLAFFQDEADRFEAEFRGQARLSADRMLDDSRRAINDVLNSYGMPVSSAAFAAQRLARGSDLNTEAEQVVKAATMSKDVDLPAKEKHRASLAEKVEDLKKLQQTVKKHQQTDEDLLELFRKDRAKFEVTHGDRARKNDRELVAARNALKIAWIKAERLHPILAAFRSGRELEKVDLGRLDTDPVERQMKAVLVQLLPKIVDIGKAKGLLKYKKNFALALPSVVALTRANMFIPEGSIRAGIANDLAAEAKDDDGLIQTLALALALITLIPSGGASLAITASVGLAAYSAAKEWEKYGTQKTLVNTDLDLARSLSADEPSLTAFAVSLVSLGFEGLPLISAFNKARKIKALVNAGEEAKAAAAANELNAFGKSHGADDDLGKRVLADAKAAEKRAATGSAKPAGKTWPDPYSTEKAAEKEINTIGSITGGPLNDDTVRLLNQKPALRSALSENELAARALKKCNTPCYPPNTTSEQIRTLEQYLERIKSTGKYDENMLREFLYNHRDNLDKAIGDVINNKNSRALNRFLRTKKPLKLNLPPPKLSEVDGGKFVKNQFPSNDWEFQPLFEQGGQRAQKYRGKNPLLSSEPEWYSEKLKTAVEVKRKDFVESLRSVDWNKITLQLEQRIHAMPPGTKNWIVFDIRRQGEAVALAQAISSKLSEKWDKIIFLSDDGALTVVGKKVIPLP
jgi:hypothetical protein